MARYYFTANGKTVHGPLEEAVLREAYRNGTLTAETRICQEGFEGWRSLASLIPNATPASAPKTGGGELPRLPMSQEARPGTIWLAKVPSPVRVAATLVASTWLLYSWWTETGPYALSVRLLSGGGSYDVGNVEMLVLLPFGALLLFLTVYSLAAEDRWKRLSRILLFGYPITLITLHLGVTVHEFMAPWKVEKYRSVKEAAANAGFLPREVDLDPTQLINLKVRESFAITRETRGRGRETNSRTMFVPFRPEAWPDELTPVILTGDLERQLKAATAQKFTGLIRKAPLPSLARTRLGESQPTFYVIIEPGETLQKFWVGHIIVYPIAIVVAIFICLRIAFRRMVKMSSDGA